MAQNGEPPNFDIHRSATAFLAGFGPGAAYSGLIKPQAFGHKGRILPTADLAASWEQPDHTTYVFKIRPNAKFHNVAPVNGRVATADDVVASFKRQLAEKVNASNLGTIEAITATDQSTVRITTPTPNVDFLATLIDPRNKVAAKELFDSGQNLEKGPTIGTGPWIFEDWQRGIGISLVRNPDYFIPGQPYADRLEFPQIKDASGANTQFLAGRLTANPVGGTGVPANSLPEKQFTIYSSQPQANNWIQLNQATLPQVKDPRMRKALSAAIDRKLIISSVFNGIGSLDATGLVLPGADWQIPEAELEKALAYDPKGAKQMYESLGKIPSQTLQSYNVEASLALAQIVQSNFKDIGFDTTIKPIDNLALAGVFSGATEFTVVASPEFHTSTLTGDLVNSYATGGSRNSAKLSDPDLDAKISRQAQEFDEAKRKVLVLELLRYLVDKSYHLGLTAVPTRTATANTTHNFEPLVQVNGEYSQFAETWFDA